MRLRGKVAVVTGSGGGIGRSIAQRFSGEGASVVLVDVNAASGATAAEAIRGGGGECCFVPGDVSREDDVGRVADETLERYGTVDILCNNAAILLSDKEARVHELSSEAWDRTLAVNLTGYWLCSKYLIPVVGEAFRFHHPRGLSYGAPRLP